MNILSGIHKQDSLTELAVIKQEAVFKLREAESRVVGVVNRAFQGGCIQEFQLRQWLQQLTSRRRILQDSFLLETSVSDVHQYIQDANSQFVELVKRIENEVIATERNTDIEVRLKNVDEGFKNQFKELYLHQNIHSEIVLSLENQVQLYKSSLLKNFQSHEIRPEIKVKLLHDLVDDYYEQIHELYMEAVSHIRKA